MNRSAAIIALLCLLGSRLLSSCSASYSCHCYNDTVAYHNYHLNVNKPAAADNQCRDIKIHDNWETCTVGIAK